MTLIKLKVIALLCALFAIVVCSAQSPTNQIDSLNNMQKMENKIVIGKIFVPENSIEEFRRQNVTSGYLKTLPGFLKGETYENMDDSGNLHMITVTTWANQEAYNNAQLSLNEYYKSIKFNPMAFRKRLNIVAEHGLYSLLVY